MIKLSRTIFDAIENRETETFEPSEPQTPTDAPPGSIAKVQLMIERLHRGEAIFHPGDSRCHATIEAQEALMAYCQEHSLSSYSKRLIEEAKRKREARGR
jgi:hypothetical protein